MRAVSKTSPLSNLAYLDRLELLKLQVDESWIPTAVKEELQTHPYPMARGAIEKVIHERCIRVATPQDMGPKMMLLEQMHWGEELAR